MNASRPSPMKIYLSDEKIHALGFMYLLFPVGIGVLIMLTVALITNNMAKNRKYPEFLF